MTRLVLIAVMGTATVAMMEVGDMVNDGVEGDTKQGDTMALAPVARIVATGLPDSWEAAITTLVAAREHMAGNILRYRYATGMLAMTVAEDRGKSDDERRLGNHTLHDIAVEIGEKDSTVYDCMRFRSRTSPEQLDHLISQGWAWRAACALVTVEDYKVREELQNRYEQGGFANSDAFKEEVRDQKEAANLCRSRKRVAKDKKAKRSFGGRYIKSRIAGFNTVSGVLKKDTIPQLLDGLNKFRERHQNLVPVTAANIATLISEVSGNVDVLLKLLADVRARLAKMKIPAVDVTADEEA